MSHSMEIKIYYEDTDAGGVVYYANYLRYMERGRTEYLADRCGVSLRALMDQDTLFAASRVEIEYRSYAFYGDIILVETRLSEITAATLLFEHIMKEKKTGRLIAEGSIRLVCVNSKGKPKRIPSEVAEKLK